MGVIILIRFGGRGERESEKGRGKRKGREGRKREQTNNTQHQQLPLGREAKTSLVKGRCGYN